MRSIEARFKYMSDKNPFLSSYINFAKAIKGQGFSRSAIANWFNKLVEKGDYQRKDKDLLIDNLVIL